VHLNINHDMRYAMARTGVRGVGKLDLSTDDVGLRTYALLDPDISFVRDLQLQMNAGIIDQMSFAFTIARETRVEVDDGDLMDVLYRSRRSGTSTTSARAPRAPIRRPTRACAA
jgi:HK97 family phage prohead protease